MNLRIGLVLATVLSAFSPQAYCCPALPDDAKATKKAVKKVNLKGSESNGPQNQKQDGKPDADKGSDSKVRWSNFSMIAIPDSNPDRFRQILSQKFNWRF